jgi:hypothetical protein
MSRSKLISYVTVGSFRLLVKVDASGKLLLPDNSTVSGCLLLTGMRELTELPTNLHVIGNLALDFTSVTALPRGLRVGLFLDVTHTGIAELPEDLVVRGDIYVRGSKIRQIPPTVRFGGEVVGLGRTSLRPMESVVSPAPRYHGFAGLPAQALAPK